MRILHTADWHVGKRLGRIDRSAECASVLDEIVAVARDRSVDLVVVAGDLFDRGLPPFASLRVVVDALLRLSATGARVVAIPGNHDSAELFDVLRPLLEPSGISLVHKALRPDEGGIVEVASRDGAETARLACFPFLHQAHVVDFMATEWEQHKTYADRVRAICRHYGDWLDRNSKPGAIDVLVGHFMIHNAIPSGSERALYIGEAYMAREDALPHVFDYVALGHIHQAQVAPGSESYARYAGSVMQLDFGEAGQDKSVVVADVTADGKREVELVPIRSARTLRKVRGTLDELKAQADDLQDAILSVEVTTELPSPTLTDEVREFLPGALYVRVDNPRTAAPEPRHGGLSIEELYAAYHEQRYGIAPGDEVKAAFHELVDEVGVRL